jgi:hypothetical protein
MTAHRVDLRPIIDQCARAVELRIPRGVCFVLIVGHEGEGGQLATSGNVSDVADVLREALHAHEHHDPVDVFPPQGERS